MVFQVIFSLLRVPQKKKKKIPSNHNGMFGPFLFRMKTETKTPHPPICHADMIRDIVVVAIC